MGVQMFRDLTRQCRLHPTDVLHRFARTVRASIARFAAA